MDKELVDILKSLEPIIEEMGEERLCKYIKCYLLLKLPKNQFYKTFKEYVDGREKISINSFRNFLIEKNDKELKEIMRQIQIHNS